MICVGSQHLVWVVTHSKVLQLCSTGFNRFQRLKQLECTAFNCQNDIDECLCLINLMVNEIDFFLFSYWSKSCIIQLELTAVWYRASAWIQPTILQWAQWLRAHFLQHGMLLEKNQQDGTVLCREILPIVGNFTDTEKNHRKIEYKIIRGK